MKSNYYVARRQHCGRCDGDGIVINEEYERFLERYGSRWRYAARVRWGEDERKWPKPEIVCPECKGEGIVTEWVPLEEALAEMNDKRIFS